MTEISRVEPRVGAVMGDPIHASRSPAIHNAAFRTVGLPWTFVALRVSAGSGADAVHAAKTLGFFGLSVTMPLKYEVLEACDELSPRAAELEAVNCIVFRDGRAIGDNTDGAGLVRSLRDEGVNPNGAKVVLLGAGGAARAIGDGLVGAGAQVVVAARRPEAVTMPGVEVVSFTDVGDALRGAAAIVNATPVGMDGEGEPIAATVVPLDSVVIDTITSPTPWVAALRDRGVHAVNGLGMLVGQGAVAFERWTGIAAPVDAMKAAVDLP